MVRRKKGKGRSQPRKRPKNSERSFPRTDAGNAELFAALFMKGACFDHRRKRWLVWRDHWWEMDKDGELLRRAKYAARARKKHALHSSDADGDQSENKELKWAMQSESLPRLNACLIIAQSEPLLAHSGDGWNADPWFLGVENGVVELRTGELRDGRQEDGITVHTGVRFDPEAGCPRWEQFQDEIFGGEQETVEFVRRAVGYTLTGDVSEECLFLCVGGGSNGKTTFLEALRHALGPYAYNMPFSTLELKNRASIPNDVAALEGRRLVTASETNESIRLNEARVKALTGRDEVTARFLHREFFEFHPVGKFWLATNHLPSVTDDSFGFWRRVRVIPFDRRFSDQEADKGLLERLKAEASGILAWAVRGCLEWQKHGLGIPASVRAATEAYRGEMDPTGEFIEQCCVVRSDMQVSCGRQWSSYEWWASLNPEHQRLDRRTFSRRMESRGFKKARVGHERTWTWLGIGLKEDHSSQETPAGADARTDADGGFNTLSNSTPI